MQGAFGVKTGFRLKSLLGFRLLGYKGFVGGVNHCGLHCRLVAKFRGLMYLVWSNTAL